MELGMSLDKSMKVGNNSDKNASDSFLQMERGDVTVDEKIQSAASKEDEDMILNGDDKLKDEWMDILGSGHLKKKTLKPGEPDSRPKKPDVCLISFVGKLDGGIIVDKEEKVEIFLGDNDTVQGLDLALALMDKGEEAEVLVSSRFAYGTIGRKPDIPPNSNINYVLTLHDFREELPVSELNIDRRLSIGMKKKERGNWWYSREEHSLAIHSYRSALEYLDITEIPNNPTHEKIKHLLDERVKTYNNLGASQMKIEAYDAALTSFNHVLCSQPENIKALFRKAKILKAKGEFEESISVVRQGLAIDPENKSLHTELSLLLAAQRKDNTKQRNLYKKMMGNSTQGNETEKKKQKSSNFGTITWIAVVSFAVAAIGAVVVRYKIT